MNVNDTVIYTENGQDHVATVLEIRNLENHLGKNGEPLLHLGFFSPIMKPGPNGLPVRQSIVGTHQQYDLAQFRLDVAHESHEFPVELKQGRYPGGRWKGVNKVTAVESDDKSDEPLPETSNETELFEDKATTKSGGIDDKLVPEQGLNNNPKQADKDASDAETEFYKPSGDVNHEGRTPAESAAIAEAEHSTEQLNDESETEDGDESFEERLKTSDSGVTDTGLLNLKSAQIEPQEPTSTENPTQDHQDDFIGDGAEDENQESLGVTEGSIR